MPFELRFTDGRALPAGKLLCVGKNYAEHVREMAGGRGNPDTPPADPVLFLKPSTSLVDDGGAVVLPTGVTNVHYETELCAIIGARAKRLAPEAALGCVAGYAVGLDMTARDLQQAAKRDGFPWTLSKAMDTFAPLSRIAPAASVPDPHAVELELRINGEVRQRGSTRDMIHPLPRILSYVTRYFTLEPGDVLFTGTPAGVGPVKPGDVLEARAGSFARLRVDVRAE